MKGLVYFIRSFGHAMRGMLRFFGTERNGQLQGMLSLVVILLGVVCRVTRTEWMVLLLCIALVVSLEMINSAIERICNLYTPEYHPAVKAIKDIAAASVLWSTILVALIGLMIFFPYFMAWLG